MGNTQIGDSLLGGEFASRVVGTVVPVLAMFEENGALDETATADYVEFLIGSGVGTIMCTVGTSRYDVLTAPEMLRVNQIVAQAARKRANVIVTTPSIGPTVQAVEFVEAASKDGADAIIAVYPDRYYGDEPIVGFFEDICNASGIGVMIHEMPIRAGRAFEAPSKQYSTALVERLLALPQCVGLKEESGDAGQVEKLNTMFAKRCAVIGGRGGMAAHLAARQYGQVTYLASIGNLAPSVELEFSRLVGEGSFDAAQTIVTEYEKPFFDVAVDLGWHLALREAMAMVGVCPPFERRPMLRIDRNQRRQLEAATKRIMEFQETLALDRGVANA